VKYVAFNTALRLKAPFSRAARVARMAEFTERMAITGGERIIDLGGTPAFWQDCPIALDITIVNLPDSNDDSPPPSHHRFTLREGDACQVDFAGDSSFDIAVSNSVIEHVGDIEKRAAFAREARRLAPAWWVQTPAIWFPIEAHCHMPFWWFYPEPVRQWFIRRWRPKLPAWTEMVETTTVVRRGELETLFPGGRVWREWKLGFVKSYVIYNAPGKPKTSRKAS
jgi:hypothetical protein